jgi:hypothetical protein
MGIIVKRLHISAASDLYHAVFVFIFSVSVIAFQIFIVGIDYVSHDADDYFSVAIQLYETGIFKNGNMVQTDAVTYMNLGLPPAENGEGMFFAPLYPAFLSLLMYFSDGFVEAVQCYVDSKRECPLNFEIMWAVQSVFGAASSVFVWLTCQKLFQKKAISWICVFLLASVDTFAHYAYTVYVEALILPLFYAAMYFMVCTIKTRRPIDALLFGVSCGLLILTKSAFIYMIYFIAFCGVGLILWQMKSALVKRSILLLVLASMGTALVIGPWIYRNYTKIGVPAVTFGYGAFILAQRVAYNDMTAKEWWIGWVYGLPRVGGDISSLLFDKEDYERWDFFNPTGFYLVGNLRLRPETLKAAGSHQAHLGYLIKNYVLDDLAVHTLVTLLIIFRGMWVLKEWLFIPYLALLYVAWIGIRERDYLFIFYALPPWFMLGLHGFVSINLIRYNIILQGCLAIALAFCLYEIAKRNSVLKRMTKHLVIWESS